MKKLFLVMAVSGLGLTFVHAQATAPAAQPATTTQAPKMAQPATANVAPNQPVDVPEVVKTKFTADNADAKDVTWRKMGNNYGAFYKVDNRMSNVVYSATGDLMRSYKQIDPAKLPKAITDYTTANMAGQPVKAASQVMRGKGPSTYEIMVGDKRLTFDSDGKLITPTAPVAPAAVPGATPSAKPVTTPPATPK